MSLCFLPAEPGDVDRIYQLNRQLIDQYEDVDAIDYDRVLAWVAQNIEDQLPYFKRVFRDGELVGFYGLIPSEDGAELDSLFVLPEYQNRGIGTAILQNVVNTSDSSVFLYVFRKNTGAISLYRRMGFEITRELGRTRYIMRHEAGRA